MAGCFCSLGHLLVLLFPPRVTPPTRPRLTGYCAHSLHCWKFSYISIYIYMYVWKALSQSKISNIKKKKRCFKCQFQVCRLCFGKELVIYIYTYIYTYIHIYTIYIQYLYIYIVYISEELFCKTQYLNMALTLETQFLE